MPRDTTPTTTTNANAFTSPSALARRIAYDAFMDTQPVARAIRDRYANAPSAQRMVAPRAPRVHRDARMERGPNAWETQGPHMATHLTPDRACHHPLVKCAHKW